MRKTVSLLLFVILCFGLLAGCTSGQEIQSSEPARESSQTTKEAPAPSGSEPESESEADASANAFVLPDTVRVSALKGPTAMGMVKLMQDSEDGAAKLGYDFAITTIDDIIPRISKGEIDIAAVPANLASVLYNNTGGAVQVLAINTLGVLYVVEKGEEIQGVADLAGKTVYATGKGAVPEFALNYVLSQNGLDPMTDVTIEYKSEPAEIIPLLAQSDSGIALVPQPFVTTALSKVEGLRVALDWNKEWDAVSQDGSSLLTGVMVVRKEFAEQYPDAVALFCQEYAASAAYAQSNVSETAQLVGKYEIVDAAIAEQALPACNITYIDGMAMREKLAGYLNVLAQQNPQSVGGTLPDEGFYYIP